MRVLIAPDDARWLSNRLFHPSADVRDNCLQPFRYLRQFLADKGIEIATFDLGDPAKADRIVFFELKRFTPLYQSLDVTSRDQRVLVIWEPPAVCPPNYDPDLHALFGTILTWNDDLVNGRKYRKLQFPVPRYPRRQPVPFAERKLLCTILSNKASRHPDSLYRERIRAIRYFELRCPDQFGFFGVGWHRPVTAWQRLHLAPVPRFPSYRGPVESKQEVLRHYRFALCYENMRTTNGYITEKVLDAMQAGTVPIYLGADNASRYLHPDAYIDARQFPTYSDLYAYVSGMQEPEYQSYLSRIAAYLEGEHFAQFLPKRFAQTVHDALVHPGTAEQSRPNAEARGRRKVEARYLAEESRRAFARGEKQGFRRMFHRLLRLDAASALRSPGLVARYAASLVGMAAKRRE